MSMSYDLFRCNPRIVAVKADDCLFREGEPGTERIYVLIAGQANIFVKERLAEEAGVGTIVGEMGVVSPHEARTATVRAVTDCEFAELDAKQFHFLISQAPDFALEVMRVLADRLRRADQMLA